MAGGGTGTGGEPEITLEHTPTWIVAAVCSVIVVISLVFERLLHGLGKVRYLLAAAASVAASPVRLGALSARARRSGEFTEPVTTKPARIQNSNLNLKIIFLKKISKNILRCDESNDVKFSQKFVHLV